MRRGFRSGTPLSRSKRLRSLRLLRRARRGVRGQPSWLRIAAGIGLAVLIVTAIVDDAGADEPRDAVGGLIALAAAAVVIATVVRPAAARAVRSLDLLVPVVLALFAERVLWWLATPLGFLLASEPIRVGKITIDLTGLFLAQIAVWTIAAAWTTLLVLDERDRRPLDLSTSLARTPSVLAATLIVCLIGHGAVLSSAGLIFLPIASAGEGSFIVAVVAVALPFVAWNVATAGMLATVVERPSPFGRALAATVDGARRHWKRWVLPVAAQLLALGLLTYAFATIERTTETTRGGRFTTTHSTTHRSNWNVNVFWAGAHEHSSRWIDAVAGVRDRTPSSTAALFARLAGLLLAVSMRMTVASTLRDPTKPLEPAEPTPPNPVPGSEPIPA